MFLTLAVVGFLVTAVLSQPPAQTFFPASIPLAIRSPYTSLWHSSQAGASPLSSSWPLFWGRQNALDVQSSIRVDGATFLLSGENNPPVGDLSASVMATQITPTRTIFVMQAGPMNVTLTFISPVDPSDWVTQSFPFFYLSVEAASLDGRAHDVQVYAEISGGLLSIDPNTAIKGIQYSTNETLIQRVQFIEPRKYVEVAQQAQDGEAYIAMATQPNQTWQIDNHAVSRRTFHDKGALLNTSMPVLPLIGVNVTVFAIAVGLGQIQSTSSPQVWSVGFVRSPSVSYTTPEEITLDLSPYFMTRYSGDGVDQAIDDFLKGFPDEQSKAIALDDAIISKASTISAQYADLVSLAARSTLGSLDITVSSGSDGKPNATDVRIFMKDIASTQSTGRVNPVENIYGALPLLLYLNASLVGPLLSPLLDVQDNLAGVLPYAAQDIGLAYPNATGTRGQHNQGVEQTGNMLIMLYAHARFSGDGSLIHKHYNLTKRWADYLVQNTLNPTDQFSADTEVQQKANMTNLALKGIIGVKAMAEMSRALGEQEDAHTYDVYASNLTASWRSYALSSDGQHLLGVYGDQQSWALMYNIYADRLLDTGIADNTLLQLQTTFYGTLLATSPQYGLPIDNDAGGISNAAWSLFTAATVLDTDVRDEIIAGVWNRASSNGTQGPFPETYDSSTGAIQGGLDATAGPSLGAMFSLLALSVPNVTIVAPPLTTTTLTKSTSNGGSHMIPVAVIAGTASGGVAFMVLIGLGLWLVRRRRRYRKVEEQMADRSLLTTPTPYLAGREPSQGSSRDIIDVPMSEVGPSAASSYEPSTSESLAALASTSSLLPPSHPGPSQKPRQKRALGKRFLITHTSPLSSPFLPESTTSAVRTPVGRRPSEGGSGSVPYGSQNDSTTPTTEVAGLRAEITDLRRVVRQMRREVELPPQYTTQ